jgi:two-component system response regulator PhoP
MRLLLVEDELQIRQALALQLQQSGFVVDEAADGQEGLYYFSEFPYSAAIVDLGLPKLDGIGLIQQVRAQGNKTPIVILTARDHWQQKVEGLDAGADDYVAKPFQTEELLARLNALVRRAAGHASAKLSFGSIWLDLKEQRVGLLEKEIEVTDFEYRLLAYFFQHPDEVLSKSILMDQLYGQDAEADSNTIEVFIRRLRKKIDPDNTLKPIETLRGRGYRFCPAVFQAT